MAYRYSAKDLSQRADYEAQEIQRNREEIKRLQRETEVLVANRSRLLQRAAEAERGEAALKAEGGITNSEALALYHAHGCSLGLGWGATTFCGGGIYRGHDGGVWTRVTYGWRKATPEETHAHWRHGTGTGEGWTPNDCHAEPN